MLRDGLQDHPTVVSTEDKRAIAEALLRTGVRELEVASFVSPSRVPQMADAEALLAALPRPGEVSISGIALNLRGVRRAVHTHLDELRLVVSASAAHSKANAGRTTEEALDEVTAAVHEAATAAPGLRLVGAVSTAFQCPYDGQVPVGRLLDVVRGFRSAGVDHVNLADTLGTATPEHVGQVLTQVRNEFPDVVVGLHLHDANGQALSTVDLAVELGVRRFDSALGGLGRCPFAPGAQGNLATETLVAHLHERGIPTGIDEEALTRAASVLRAALG